MGERTPLMPASIQATICARQGSRVETQEAGTGNVPVGKQRRVAPLRRKESGSFTPKKYWSLYAENEMAPLRRKLTAGHRNWVLAPASPVAQQ